MNWSLITTTPPAMSPVTVDGVKTHTHIDGDADDATIQTWIDSATTQGEDYQGRSYINRTYELSYDAFPSMPIEFPRAPLVSVTSITCYDQLNVATVIPLTDFFVDITSTPGRMCHAFNKSWPSIQLRPMRALVIIFVAGYGVTPTDIPATVRDAIMLYCAHRNENRASESEEAPKQFFDILYPNKLWNK